MSIIRELFYFKIIIHETFKRNIKFEIKNYNLECNLNCIFDLNVSDFFFPYNIAANSLWINTKYFLCIHHLNTKNTIQFHCAIQIVTVLIKLSRIESCSRMLETGVIDLRVFHSKLLDNI